MDLASELFEKNPDESSIRYAAQVLKKKNYKDYPTYKLVLRYFLNLSFLFPYIIDTCDFLIGRGLIIFKNQKTEIKIIVQEAFEKVLREHSKYRRSDAITWCLYLAIEYELVINNFTKIENDILKTKDPIPVLMVYLYKKVRKETIDYYKKLILKVDASEWWLFVYEISRIENIQLSDTEMEKIKNAGITFLSDEITLRL